MKYWQTKEPPSSAYWQRPRPAGSTGWIFVRVGDLRRYLREHPEVPGAYRYWTVGNDDVGRDWYSREELLAPGGGRRAMRGHTLRWGRAHGMGW